MGVTKEALTLNELMVFQSELRTLEKSNLFLVSKMVRAYNEEVEQQLLQAILTHSAQAAACNSHEGALSP